MSVAPSAPSGRTSWASSSGPARRPRRARSPRGNPRRSKRCSQALDVELGRRVLEAQQQHVGAARVPDRHVPEDRLVGAQDDARGLVVRLVEVEPLRVDAAGRQAVARAAQELLAVEHLDAGDPGVAGLRDDHVELALAAQQRAVGVAADRVDLRVLRRVLVARSRRAAPPRAPPARSRPRSTSLHVVERGELAGGDAEPPADHEGRAQARRAAGPEPGRPAPWSCSRSGDSRRACRS